mmetsp:Transcript_44858/g.116185  ORF Transcript_44858/g.116185 Transcript_44858/m.116185 type:complete len:237 (+) Transcript_44858:1137-1847(+)
MHTSPLDTRHRGLKSALLHLYRCPTIGSRGQCAIGHLLIVITEACASRPRHSGLAAHSLAANDLIERHVQLRILVNRWRSRHWSILDLCLEVDDFDVVQGHVQFWILTILVQQRTAFGLRPRSHQDASVHAGPTSRCCACAPGVASGNVARRASLSLRLHTDDDVPLFIVVNGETQMASAVVTVEHVRAHSAENVLLRHAVLPAPSAHQVTEAECSTTIHFKSLRPLRGVAAECAD